jgi:hypothetical protein
VAAAVAEVADRNAVPWITGAALRCRGLAAGDPGTLRAAVDAYAAGSRPLELALAAEDAGAALARAGDAAAATALLERALAGYERLDAARPAARAEAALRRLGVRRGARGPRRRPRLGWESLTPTEGRVVDLVAEGPCASWAVTRNGWSSPPPTPPSSAWRSGSRRIRWS